MTDEEKKAWLAEFARLNQRRRVRVARGDWTGRYGSIVGRYGSTGVLYGETDIAAVKSIVRAGSDYYGKNSEILIDHRGGSCWFDNPENLDPIDGLGPLLIPGEHSFFQPESVPLSREAIVKVRRPVSKGEMITSADIVSDALRAADADNQLRLASERALRFFAALVPLPGWSRETEQELLACARGLKEALVRK